MNIPLPMWRKSLRLQRHQPCAHPLAIVQKEVNIAALAKIVGITESAVSHHMRGLRQMRIVRARRDGKEVYYSVDDPHIIALFQQGVKHVQEE